MAQRRRSVPEIRDGLKQLVDPDISNRSRDELLHEVQVFQERLLAQNEELLHAQQELEATRDHLFSVQEEERQRIARDLHDNFGQHLTALRLALETLAAEAHGQGPAIRDRIRQSLAAIQHLDDTLDQMATDLRPAALDLGFEAALAQFVRQWSHMFGVDAEFVAHGLGTGRLPPDSETHLYRITQEALNNVYKHARATKVNVLLERREEALVLIVEDNGRGFAPEHAQAGLRQGLGQTGMRERASLIGGTIDVESSPGAGTTIFVCAPFKPRPAGAKPVG